MKLLMPAFVGLFCEGEGVLEHEFLWFFLVLVASSGIMEGLAALSAAEMKTTRKFVFLSYVDGLCQAMPKRMHELVHKTRGGRLKS